MVAVHATTVQAGDADPLAAAQFEEIRTMRDDFLEQIASIFDEQIAAVRDQADDGNRAMRRKVGKIVNRLEAARRQGKRKIEQHFARVAANYDPEAGTLSNVEAEAADLLAKVLKL